MTGNKKIKVAVLMGGPSSEHEVSLESGKAVLENLNKDRYTALPVVIDKRGYWFFSGAKSFPLPEAEAINSLKEQKVDVVFIALHGKYGEDGTVQRLLADVGLKFTGSGAHASALALNKIIASKVLSRAGFNVPDFEALHYLNWNRASTALAKNVFNKIGVPLVVKPANCGSSVGVSLIDEVGDLKLTPLINAVDHSFSFGREAIVQKCVRGREFTCAALEQNGEAAALEPTEIIPVLGNFFDYKSKYTESGAEEITPPSDMSKKMIDEVKNTALRAHKVFGCSGMSRTDMILGHDGKLYVLEVNTIPGLTPLSLLPKGALAAGIKFSKLLNILIENAAL